MNTEQAKKLSLPHLLQKLGHTPSKVTKGGNELWYPSPFRNETDASFHTSFIGGKWIWNDFGDIGGTVVDFAMRYWDCRTISEALTYLDQYAPGAARSDTKPDLFSFHQHPHREAVEIFLPDRQLQLIETKPITSPAILNYLSRERSIPAELAKRYLVEIRYQNTAVGKSFFGFGMRNESGGHEVRVALASNKFKSAIDARDITVIPGSDPNDTSASLFEGMTDFLSLLVMQGKTALPGKAIIMHSLSSHARTVDYLRNNVAQEIRTYLDNNDAGQKGTEKLKAEFGDAVISFSQSFAPYADLNDALRAMHARRSGQSLG